ncbi:TetR/AcrR family transcriptional regulator, partial [Phenylobacterium sp.]|uniref:TetR/AcrR family transcriptional regulator n=1 Tax=Phenylobacterium sp. TaxID=1871053 RepID=UPI0035B2C1FF
MGDLIDPGGVPRGRRETAQASRRLEVLDGAARQLNSRGMSQSSLADLASSLGFTRNALYHYMEDISDLLAQVYERSCEILDARLRDASRAGSSLRIVQRFVALALDPELPEVAALNEYGLLRPEDRARITASYQATEDRLAQILRSGVEGGELRRCDTVIAARAIINLIHWAPLGARRGLQVGARERRDAARTLSWLLAEGWAIDRRAKIAPPQIDLSPLLVRVADGFDQAALHAVRRESILSCASR